MTQRHREERRLVTCLFIDVVGSTELTMRLGPERLKAALDEAFGDLRSLIEAQGGTVEKYIGDAIYVLFGAPLAHEDDPERALRAAAAARDWAAGRAGAEIPFAVRVGLETGEAIVDLAAAEDTRQQMSVGAVVNVAARLQQRAEPGQVLVGPVTHAATSEIATFDTLGELDLKGIGSMPAFVLGELRGVGTRRRLPFVGRETELELLGFAHRRARGRSVLALVSGPPGQGKTRLVEKFLDTLDARPLAARCRPGGEVDAFTPLRQLLVGEGGLADLEADLERRIDDHSDRSRVTDALAHSAGLRPSGALAALGADERQDEITNAWRRWLRSRSADGPVVAWIEDLHWADPSIVRLLDRITLGTDPLLVVATARPEFAQTAGLRTSGDRFFLELEPLDADSSAELARAAGSAATIEIERAEGNPLFIVELARATAPAGQLPLTVQGALGARLDELSPEDRALLSHAAVVGEAFTVEDAAALAGRQPGETARALAELADLHYLQAADGRYRFHHSLLRDVAYGRILVADRMRLHARLARERISAGDAEVLAHHWWAALDPAAADWVWKGSPELPRMRADAYVAHLAAGRRHAELFSIDRALELLGRAASLAAGPAARAEAERAMGDALASVLRADESWEQYRTALAAYREAGAVPADFYLGPLRLRMRSGAFTRYPAPDEVHALQSAAEASARAAGDDALLSRYRAYAAFDVGEPLTRSADLATLDDAVALAEASGDRGAEREVLGWKASVLIGHRRTAEAEATLDRIDALELSAGDFDRAEVLGGRCNIAIRKGDIAELERFVAEAVRISRPMGPHLRTHAEAFLTDVALQKGDWDEVRRLGAEAARTIVEHSTTKFCAYAVYPIAFGALAHAMAGRPDEARALWRVVTPGMAGPRQGASLRAVALVLTGEAVAPAATLLADGSLMGAAIVAATSRDHERALAVADVFEASAGGGMRYDLALAEAIREEVAFDRGGPEPRHEGLRAIGYVGWSDVLRCRAPARGDGAPPRAET